MDRVNKVLYPELVDRITELIYLGSRQANTPALRRAMGFTHVVQISGMPQPSEGDNSAADPSRSAQTHLYLQLDDDEEAELAPLLPRFFQFMHGLDAAAGDRVLVHCDAGMSRSASFVCAYLMREEKITFQQALAFVRERRPIVCPNDGFSEQLEAMSQAQAAASPAAAASSAPAAVHPSPLPLALPTSASPAVASAAPAAAQQRYAAAASGSPAAAGAAVGAIAASGEF